MKAHASSEGGSGGSDRGQGIWKAAMEHDPLEVDLPMPVDGNVSVTFKPAVFFRIVHGRPNKHHTIKPLTGAAAGVASSDLAITCHRVKVDSSGYVVCDLDGLQGELKGGAHSSTLLWSLPASMDVDALLSSVVAWERSCEPGELHVAGLPMHIDQLTANQLIGMMVAANAVQCPDNDRLVHRSLGGHSECGFCIPESLPNAIDLHRCMALLEQEGLVVQAVVQEREDDTEAILAEPSWLLLQPTLQRLQVGVKLVKPTFLLQERPETPPHLWSVHQCMQHLRLSGWVHRIVALKDVAELEPHRADSVKVYYMKVGNKTMQKGYAQCLVCSMDLFSKGCTGIWPCQKDAYYKKLLRNPHHELEHPALGDGKDHELLELDSEGDGGMLGLGTSNALELENGSDGSGNEGGQPRASHDRRGRGRGARGRGRGRNKRRRAASDSDAPIGGDVQSEPGVDVHSDAGGSDSGLEIGLRPNIIEPEPKARRVHSPPRYKLQQPGASVAVSPQEEATDMLYTPTSPRSSEKGSPPPQRLPGAQEPLEPPEPPEVPEPEAPEAQEPQEAPSSKGASSDSSGSSSDSSDSSSGSDPEGADADDHESSASACRASHSRQFRNPRSFFWGPFHFGKVGTGYCARCPVHVGDGSDEVSVEYMKLHAKHRGLPKPSSKEIKEGTSWQSAKTKCTLTMSASATMTEDITLRLEPKLSLDQLCHPPSHTHLRNL